MGDPAGYTSIGLQFTSLSGPDRAFLQNYVDDIVASGVDLGLNAGVTAKYRLSFDAAGRLRMFLSGLLHPEEAHAFAAMLEARLRSRSTKRIAFEIDVRSLSACTPESVGRIRQAFEVLAHREEVFGLFIGKHSIALTQLLRVARESGMGDSVFSVNDADEAQRIWDQLED